MKGRPIPYSAEELAWIEANSKRVRREAYDDFCRQFNRGDVTLGAYNALCKRKGWMTGRTGCFGKGIVPHNKGRKGYRAPGCEKGWFRKGQEPHNTKWLGHERVSKDGYVEISVARTNPHTGYRRRYVLKHRWLWEQKHGPLPKGMALKCLDGDKTNTDPSNWEAVPRALLPRLNGGRNKTKVAYDTAPAELKPTILVVAKLEHQARARGAA